MDVIERKLFGAQSFQKVILLTFCILNFALLAEPDVVTFTKHTWNEMRSFVTRYDWIISFNVVYFLIMSHVIMVRLFYGIGILEKIVSIVAWSFWLVFARKGLHHFNMKASS